jgi:hypothetical protein
VADLPEAQALDDLGLILVEANRALHEGDFQLLLLIGHD